MAKLKVGDKAPDFSLPSNSGNFTLSQFFGKNVVIYFYPMDESPVCSKEAEAFKDKYETFKKLDAEVAGINPQSIESHKAFASNHNLPFMLLSDRDNVVRKLYGVLPSLGILPKRVTFVIDKEGVIRHIFSSQLHPATHADEALEVLKGL